MDASYFGSTQEPINKWPVTDTVLNTAGLADCHSSEHGGPRSASNFRSDHPGGTQFLFCDGSVHFLQEGIDLLPISWSMQNATMLVVLHFRRRT